MIRLRKLDAGVYVFGEYSIERITLSDGRRGPTVTGWRVCDRARRVAHCPTLRAARAWIAREEALTVH